MAVPATGILYSFTGADANPDTTFTSLLNNLQRVSNQGSGGSAADCVVYYPAAQYGANCETYFTVVTKPGAANYVTPMLRLKDIGSILTIDGYQLVALDAAGTDVLTLQRIDNGVGTNLAVINQEYSAGDIMLLRMIGSTIEVWARLSGTWTLLTTQTDATYAAAGYFGISVKNTTVRIDDFGGGTLVSPPGIRPSRQRLAGIVGR